MLGILIKQFLIQGDLLTLNLNKKDNFNAPYLKFILTKIELQIDGLVEKLRNFYLESLQISLRKITQLVPPTCPKVRNTDRYEREGKKD